MDKSGSMDRCAICERKFEEYTAGFTSRFDHLVCQRCDELAVTKNGEPPKYGNRYVGEKSVLEELEEKIKIRMAPDDGDNPVYIDGKNAGAGIDLAASSRFEILMTVNLSRGFWKLEKGSSSISSSVTLSPSSR